MVCRPLVPLAHYYQLVALQGFSPAQPRDARDSTWDILYAVDTCTLGWIGLCPTKLILPSATHNCLFSFLHPVERGGEINSRAGNQVAPLLLSWWSWHGSYQQPWMFHQKAPISTHLLDCLQVRPATNCCSVGDNEIWITLFLAPPACPPELSRWLCSISTVGGRTLLNTICCELQRGEILMSCFWASFCSICLTRVTRGCWTR